MNKMKRIFMIAICGFVAVPSYLFSENSAEVSIILSIEEVSTSDNLFTIGVKNNSDAEFRSPPFNGFENFDADSQTAGDFPKELNTDWYPHQYVKFTLNQPQANNGISFELDPAWNDSPSALRVAVDVWRGSSWEEAGSALLNGTDSGYVDIHPGLLTTGLNEMRLRAVDNIGNTGAITWDQIKIATLPVTTVWRIGNNDNSERELDQSNFLLLYTVGNPVSWFPKELNSSWWANQYINFSLTTAQCQKGAVLSFDAFWSDGNGSLIVGLDAYNGTNWVSIGTAAVSQSNPGFIVIPANFLKEGMNYWRLKTISGTNGTTTVVWDSLALYQRKNLPVPVTFLLNQIMDASINFFLSPQAIHSSGLPLTALKATDRGRFGYSNPTEWGYALQAWIVAAERGHVTNEDAKNRMDTALTTMRNLQLDPNQFKYGLFYPYYTLLDGNGNNLPSPVHDSNPWLPSGDCALLYASINVIEGWLRINGYAATADKALAVKNAMNFRSCYESDTSTSARIHHLINADTGELSPAAWNVYADEGGMVAFVSYIAGSISLKEYNLVLDNQYRTPASWNDIKVREAAWFNAMFTWAQRSMVGFPMFGNSKQRVYGIQSFLPNVTAHLNFGQSIGVDYPAFSDAMTQTYQGTAMVGSYTPPNISDSATTSHSHIMPHALAVPFCALDVLDENILKRLYEKWLLMRADTSGIWHSVSDQHPFGFEVVGSPSINNAAYSGADDGRLIFESLSHGYTLLPIFEGVQRYGSKRTFGYYADQVSGYTKKVNEILNTTYPND